VLKPKTRRRLDGSLDAVAQVAAVAFSPGAFGFLLLIQCGERPEPCALTRCPQGPAYRRDGRHPGSGSPLMLSEVARQGKVSQQLGRKSKLLPCAASQGSGPRVSAAGATCLFRAAARNVPTEGQALAATIKLRHDTSNRCKMSPSVAPFVVP
jgi:hypothetical protein